MKSGVSIRSSVPDAAACAGRVRVSTRGLVVRYPVSGFGAVREVRAVDGVDLELRAGETLALVGESGCGKSSLARALVGLERPAEGSIHFDGAELTTLSRAERRRLQLIFQDPVASLNPRMSAGAVLREAFFARGCVHEDEVGRLLERVGLEASAAQRYPHEFSGGQRQRLALARALAVDPAVLVADEPVSGLDASLRARVLELLARFRDERALALLLVSHDVRLVERHAQRVAVMYLGRLVESLPSERLVGGLLHPYTRALWAAAPRLEAGRFVIPAAPRGEPPSPLARPSGCAFEPRCPEAMALCRESAPRLLQVAPEHRVACHRSASSG